MRSSTVPSPVAELRAVTEEERHVCPEARGDGVEVVARERRVERPVREPEGRRGVGASAAEARSHRDPLLDVRMPARFDSGGVREGLQGRPHDRVLGEPGDREALGRLQRDLVVQGRFAGGP